MSGRWRWRQRPDYSPPLRMNLSHNEVPWVGLKELIIKELSFCWITFKCLEVLLTESCLISQIVDVMVMVMVMNDPLVFMIITIWQDDQIIMLSFDNRWIIKTSSCWMSGLILASPQNLISIWEEFFGGAKLFNQFALHPLHFESFFSYKEVWCALQAPRVHQISGGLMRFLWQKGEIPSFRRSAVTWCMHINNWNSFSLLTDFSL